MTEELFIWVRNWERFQHYRDRTPDWIKSYTEVMSSDDYLGLSLARRGILHGLWLEFASSRRRLRLNTATISRRLNGRVTVADLEALNQAGFIQIVASSALAECEQTYSAALASRAPARSREPEPEKEIERTTSTEARPPEPERASNGLPFHEQLELVKLLDWCGDDRDERTGATIRRMWEQAPPPARRAVEASMSTATPRHRGAWLVAAIKAETERARGAIA